MGRLKNSPYPISKKAVRRAKRDSWHSFVESMNSQTPTVWLDKVISSNETVRVSKIIKHNGGFTKSPLKTRTICSISYHRVAASQQTENHATISDLVDNPFIRPEDRETISTIIYVHTSIWKQLLTNFNHLKPQGQTGSILRCYRKVGIT